MKRKATTLLLCAAIVTSSLGLQGCDKLKKLIGSGERAVIYCETGLLIVRQLQTDQLISPTKAEQLSQAINRVKSGAMIFVERTKSYLGRKIDDGIKAELAALLPELIAGIVQLEKAGLIDLPDTIKQRFDVVMSVLKAAVQIAESRLR